MGRGDMAIRKVIIRLLRILALLLGVLALSFLSGCWNWFVEKQLLNRARLTLISPLRIFGSLAATPFGCTDG
jgi:hypothetical protein